MGNTLIVLALLIAGALAVLLWRGRDGASPRRAAREARHPGEPAASGADTAQGTDTAQGEETARETEAPALNRAGEIVGLAEPTPVLPPVLLPPRPEARDVDAVRFSVALRGYRCDEVDAVLSVLGEEITRLREENASLRAAGSAGGQPHESL